MDRASLEFEQRARMIGYEHERIHRWLKGALAYVDCIVEAGVFDAVPSEQWQGRGGGGGPYLYLVFGLAFDGSYRGPDGKRKLYVGCDLAAIQLARDRVERTRVVLAVREQLEKGTQNALWLETELTRLGHLAARIDPGSVAVAPGVAAPEIFGLTRRSGDGE